MMGKIERNSPCACGSGKKFKKCCIDKPAETITGEDFMSYIASFMSYEEVNQLTTEDIIKRLEDLGIKFDKDIFLKEINNNYSAQDISDGWFKMFNVIATGRDEDFPFYAAWILWERLAPRNLLSMEQISDLLDKGIKLVEAGNSIEACDLWLKVWEALKLRVRKEDKTLDRLDSQYQKAFLVQNFVQDLEEELNNAGRLDKSYLEKKIIYCREFLDYFPEEDNLIIHNMRCAIAFTYERLGNYSQAELEYQEIINDYPDNPWGYIGWGDMNFFSNSITVAKAKGLYLKALEVAGEDQEMLSIIEGRLDGLNEE